MLKLFPCEWDNTVMDLPAHAVAAVHASLAHFKWRPAGPHECGLSWLELLVLFHIRGGANHLNFGRKPGSLKERTLAHQVPSSSDWSSSWPRTFCRLTHKLGSQLPNAARSDSRASGSPDTTPRCERCQSCTTASSWTLCTAFSPSEQSFAGMRNDNSIKGSCLLHPLVKTCAVCPDGGRLSPQRCYKMSPPRRAWAAGRGMGWNPGRRFTSTSSAPLAAPSGTF